MPPGRVAIIGAGETGVISGVALAELCVRAGYSTLLEDVLPGNLRRASAAMVPDIRIEYAGTIEDAVRAADFILDTVPDELESKLEILSLLDRMAPPAALLATPTNSLSIADLASCTYRAGQCFGLGFALGEPLRIELKYPPACTADTLARMQAFLEALGAVVSVREDTQALP